MPNITAFGYIDGHPTYLVDNTLTSGVVEDATSICDGQERRVWLLDGRPHRVGAPAIIEPGTELREWCQHGRRHRDDGPAWIGRTGIRAYALNGYPWFWALPESLWAAAELRWQLHRSVYPSSPRGEARQAAQQRAKTLRLLTRQPWLAPRPVLQATVAEALASSDADLRRWGQSVLPLLGTRVVTVSLPAAAT